MANRNVILQNIFLLQWLIRESSLNLKSIRNRIKSFIAPKAKEEKSKRRARVKFHTAVIRTTMLSIKKHRRKKKTK